MENLAICTVVYENYDVLQEFFDSLEKQTNKNFHVYIADTSKHPQTIDCRDLPCTIIQTENKGYAHGINEGLKRALQNDFTQFCVINDDVYFEKDFVQTVQDSLETHAGAIVGGKIYYAPGYEFHTERYTKDDRGKVIWYAGGWTDWNHVVTHHRGVDEVDNGQFDTVEETGFVSGCQMCFDKSVIDTIGLWDASYFLYYEDTDYCERAVRKGIRLIYDPTIELWHKNAQSTDGSGSKLHQYYQTKNRLKFGLKYAPLRTKIHLVKNTFFKT